MSENDDALSPSVLVTLLSAMQRTGESAAYVYVQARNKQYAILIYLLTFMFLNKYYLTTISGKTIGS